MRFSSLAIANVEKLFKCYVLIIAISCARFTISSICILSSDCEPDIDEIADKAEHMFVER